MKLFDKIINWYFTKRALPYWLILVMDCLIVLASGLFCYYIDTSGIRFANHFWPLLGTLCFYLVFYLCFFRLLRTYYGVLRYSSFNDISRIALANFLAICVIAILRMFFHFDLFFEPIRMRELFFTFIIATLLMGGVRVIVKTLFDSMRTDITKPVFIYGVKEGGIGLAKSIKNETPKRFSLQGFISDEEDMNHRFLMGVEVIPNDEKAIDQMEEHRVKTLLVSPLKRNQLVSDTEFVDKLIDAGFQIYLTNTATQWDGKQTTQTNTLREIEIEDLLPRDKIEIDMSALQELLHGKRVLITGSAGSIGSEIVRQVAEFTPAEMTLIDQAETPQHDLRLMMAKDFPEIKCETIVTSICRRERMEEIFRDHKPDYVFHAAAYKHVPMMEDNPCESIQNNVEGTMILADLAVKYGVEKFVMISTDKAVNPTNVMGCSKRLCEIYVQSLDKAIKEKKVEGKTQFVTTRFGNVLGSNGSVIPLFKEQIKNGGPVTVTDPKIIRYFMLIPEACKLVLEAGTLGNGGEIYVFDMGKPVRIADLARRMILLSGAKNVEIKYTGLRDGEKLYEEVLNEAETTKPTFNSKIRIANVREYDYFTVAEQLKSLIATSYQYDDMQTVAQMKQIVPEYISKHSKYESLDKK